MDSIATFFSGRITRRQFVLGELLLLVVAIVTLAVFFTISIVASGMMFGRAFFGLGMLASLAFAFVSLGLAARRIHDLGRSGWYALLFLVSPLNLLAFIILAVEEGDGKDNRYGSAPDVRRSLVDVLFNIKRVTPQAAAAAPVVTEPMGEPVEPQD